MRWLADECVAAALVASLRMNGHDVLYVAEGARGLRDADVIALAFRESRLLLTEDKDFGELVFRRKHPVSGLVLMRIDPTQSETKLLRLMAAVDRYGDVLLERYTVVEERRLRSRLLRWA